MVRSAAHLLGTQGMNATSFSEVVAHSEAPRGSIYHHFPGGKRQLTEAAVRWVADRVLSHQRAFSGTTPEDVVRWFAGAWRRLVVDSQARAGCAIAGVAVDLTEDDDVLKEAVRASFRSWTGTLAEQLIATGLPRARANGVALAVVAGMEGALILCRAEGDVAPMDAITDELARLVAPSASFGMRAETPNAKLDT
jgi:AcrR family transcriptional regulator